MSHNEQVVPFLLAAVPFVIRINIRIYVGKRKKH
jgi:hypothetical protein